MISDLPGTSHCSILEMTLSNAVLTGYIFIRPKWSLRHWKHIILLPSSFFFVPITLVQIKLIIWSWNLFYFYICNKTIRSHNSTIYGWLSLICKHCNERNNKLLGVFQYSKDMRLNFKNIYNRNIRKPVIKLTNASHSREWQRQTVLKTYTSPANNSKWICDFFFCN